MQQRTLSHLLGSRVGAVLRLALSCAALLALSGVARSVLAQTMYPPITDRNFSIDLFEQPALGSPRLIAMSGAIDSVAEGA
ncbi:MAG TPA: hypothetical protein VG963_04905, partial [Polyangiaceae bacterium]|nr:hypothetical protein [Polyangiaceae bacterium]